MNDDEEPGALVPREAPRFELAPTLADARPTSLVYVDKKGQVRSPARYRAVQTAWYAAIGGITVAFTVVYGSIFGPIGVAAGGVVALIFGWRIREARALRRAVTLLVHDRVEEAMPILERITRSRAPARMRALAEQNLAAGLIRRGRHAEALEHQQRAVSLHGLRAHPLAIAARYGEIVTLINVDRLADARALFAERFPRPPDGDYLRVQHWVVELYLALAGGEAALDADELHARARTALGMTSGAGLLGLLAWAHDRAGDRDQAWHLLREALERTGEPLEHTLPKLHAWMQAHAAEARAAAPDED